MKEKSKEDLFINLILIAFIAIVVYQVLIPPQVALANNGDFQRLSLLGGINYRYDPWNEPENYIFFDDIEYVFKEVPIQNTGYFSTQLVIIFIARGINRIVGKSGFFDLRTLGTTCSLLYFIAYAIFLKNFRPRSTALRFSVAILSLVVLTDSAILQFFNSFYSEPAEIIFFLFMVSFFTAYIFNSEVNKKIFFMAGTVFSGVMFALAKTQDMIVLLPTFILWVWMLVDLNILKRPFNRKKKYLISFSAIIFVSIIVVSVFSYQLKASAEDTISANNFNTFFQDILMHSTDPEGDLAAFNIPAESRTAFSNTIGYDIYHSEEWKTNAMFRQTFNERVDTSTIIKFYIKKPGRLIETSIRRVKAVGVNSTFGLGIHETDINKMVIQHVNFPKTQLSLDQLNYSFVLWDRILFRITHLFNNNVGNFLLIAGTTLLSALLSLYAMTKLRIKYQILNIMLLVIFWGEYLLCMIGDSARDDIKHFFICNQVFTIMGIFLIINLLIIMKNSRFFKGSRRQTV